MQKKILVLAVAAAISTPAFADNANITIYGKAILNVEAVSNDSVAAANMARVQTNASRLGFKGSEDLGDGLKASFQYEVEMDADGSGANGLGKTRNSGVSLEAGFGKASMGVWDTPFKLSHNKIELFDNTTSFTTTKLLGRTAETTSSDFNTRKANSVNYWSPKFGALEFAAAYGASESTTSSSTTNFKNTVSASATYDADGLYISAAYETRPGQTTATETDTGARLVAQYNFGDFWIGAAFEQLKVNTSATANYTQNNSEVVASMKMGTNSLGVAYVKGGQNASADTGATQVSVRYGYGLSKRTELFAAYSSLKNEASRRMTLSGVTTAATNNGLTETVIGAGVVHSF